MNLKNNRQTELNYNNSLIDELLSSVGNQAVIDFFEGDSLMDVDIIDKITGQTEKIAGKIEERVLPGGNEVYPEKLMEDSNETGYVSLLKSLEDKITRLSGTAKVYPKRGKPFITSYSVIPGKNR